MSDSDKPIEIVFAPGSLEAMQDELSPEEMKEMMDAIHEMVATGFEGATMVDMEALEVDDPETYATLVDRIAAIDADMEVEAFTLQMPATKRTLH